jgi:hypothetical protein
MIPAGRCAFLPRDGSLERRSDNIVEPLQQQPFGKAKADAC